MSESTLRIRFDGPLLQDHSMDVNDLAPALLALSDLCRNANRRFNGDRASVRVLINANVEQHCFEFSLQFIVTFLDQVKALIATEDVKDAKEILEWIGLLGTPLGFGLFRLVKAIRNRKIRNVEFVERDGKDVVELTVTEKVGQEDIEEKVTTSRESFELLRNRTNINSVKKFVAPLGLEGYETLEFEQGPENREIITKEDAKNIFMVDTDAVVESIEEHEEPQTITALLRVYSPVYEEDADKWRFIFGSRHEYMDISETDIAQKAMERGGALADDTYRVKLQITQAKKSGKLSYKILEVLEFNPSKLHIQADFVNQQLEEKND